jgi:hypothetical protein
MDNQEKDEPWRCPYCDMGFPCPCAMEQEDARLEAEAQDYFTEEDMQMTDEDLASPYEELDELYANAPKFQKIQRSQTPVSDGHNLQRVTENARNRQLKAARKLKEIVREGPVE